MRVLVCGGRDYDDREAVEHRLTELFVATDGDATIVHGDARGADTLAADVATWMGFKVEAHPADWNQYGKAAGMIRNQEMLDSDVDLVIAFPGGRGTADMVRRAESAGVPVDRIWWGDDA